MELNRENIVERFCSRVGDGDKLSRGEFEKSGDVGVDSCEWCDELNGELSSLNGE